MSVRGEVLTTVRDLHPVPRRVCTGRGNTTKRYIAYYPFTVPNLFFSVLRVSWRLDPSGNLLPTPFRERSYRVAETLDLQVFLGGSLVDPPSCRHHVARPRRTSSFWDSKIVSTVPSLHHGSSWWRPIASTSSVYFRPWVCGAAPTTCREAQVTLRAPTQIQHSSRERYLCVCVCVFIHLCKTSVVRPLGTKQHKLFLGVLCRFLIRICFNVF